MKSKPLSVLLAIDLLTISKIRASLEDSSEEEAAPSRAKLQDDLAAHWRMTLRLMIPFGALITLVWAGTFYQDIHAAKAAMFVERSIIILAPQLDPADVLRLQASFRSIETAEDFYNLEEELRLIAARSNIDLPEFDSIR